MHHHHLLSPQNCHHLWSLRLLPKRNKCSKGILCLPLSQIDSRRRRWRVWKNLLTQQRLWRWKGLRFMVPWLNSTTIIFRRMELFKKPILPMISLKDALIIRWRFWSKKLRRATERQKEILHSFYFYFLIYIYYLFLRIRQEAPIIPHRFHFLLLLLLLRSHLG